MSKCNKVEMKGYIPKKAQKEFKILHFLVLCNLQIAKLQHSYIFFQTFQSELYCSFFLQKKQLTND